MKSAELKIVRFDECDVIATSNWSDVYVADNSYCVDAAYYTNYDPLPGVNYINIVDGTPHDTDECLIEGKSYQFDYDSATNSGYFRWRTVSQ